MLNKISVENLYKYQQCVLFIVIFLFPIQTVLFYKDSWAATFSFSGQISSVPLSIGFLFAIITCLRLEKKYLLYRVVVFFMLYFLAYAAISLHSIYVFADSQSFDFATFGETAKLGLLKKILISIGLSDSSVLYGVIIFCRDMLSSMRRVFFAFGFLAWVAFLFRKDASETFRVIRNAVMWSVALLTPYVILEVFHLYGVVGATNALKYINSMLYAPGYFFEGSSYPEIVSPNQLRGTWTEPAFFAFWIVFSTPFIISFFLEKRMLAKKVFLSFVFFIAFWSVWLLTYSRTSVILILFLMSLYFLFTVFFHKWSDLKSFGFLSTTLLVAFFIVSLWGPAEFQKQSQPPKGESVVVALQPPTEANQVKGTAISTPKKVFPDSPKAPSSLVSRVEKQVTESELMTNSLLSSFDTESRSNPTRIQQFLLELEAFKDYPIAGYGLTLSSYGLKKKMEENRKVLTGEWRERLALTERKGFFKSGIGSSSLSFSGSLASGGILGFVMIFLPLLILGVKLLYKTLRESKSISDNKVCVFISAACGFLAAISQDLGFFYFWASAGLALGMVLQSNTIKVLKKA